MCLLAVALLLALATPASAQPARVPASEERLDTAGVRWFYEERADEIDDRWQVLIMGTIERGPSAGAAIGMLCVQGMGRKLSIQIPGWTFGDGRRVQLQARVDQGAPFDVVAVGEARERDMAYLRREGAGGQAFGMLVAARERIVLRHPTDGTVVFPMTPGRPLADHGLRRCEEVLAGPF